MKKMFLLFSHTLTEEQIQDAQQSLEIEEFIELSNSLQVCWSNIPPTAKDLDLYLKPIKDWLQKQINKEDYVLVQGDFGATCKMVSFVKEIGAKAVYATTKREAIEKRIEGKIIKTSIFKHVMFREF